MHGDDGGITERIDGRGIHRTTQRLDTGPDEERVGGWDIQSLTTNYSNTTDAIYSDYTGPYGLGIKTTGDW